MTGKGKYQWIQRFNFLVKTAESKPPEKTTGVDSKDGLIPEEIIKMNIEKMKKKNTPKPQKASVSRSVSFVNVVC